MFVSNYEENLLFITIKTYIQQVNCSVFITVSLMLFYILLFRLVKAIPTLQDVVHDIYIYVTPLFAPTNDHDDRNDYGCMIK